MIDKELMAACYMAGLLHGMAVALGVDGALLQAFEQDPAENARALITAIYLASGHYFVSSRLPTAQEMAAAEVYRREYEQGKQAAHRLIQVMQSQRGE